MTHFIRVAYSRWACIPSLHTSWQKILAAPFLLPLSHLFMVVAVLARAATFAGLVDSRLNRLWREQSSN
jgi:hypothetical protein